MTLVNSPGGALQTLLSALERAGKTWRHQSGGFMAQCPAHDDRSPSLSFTNGDGKVLLECKAGCDTADVLSALALRWTDIFDEARSPSAPTPDTTYDYRNSAGTLLYQKVRKHPKRFLVRRPDGLGGWVYEIGDVPRVLYRLGEVIAAVAQGRRIYVVEGEKDADRLASLGEVATCNFDGASKDTNKPKWRVEYSDTLENANVVIIADNDDCGFAHARAVATSLTGRAESVTIVRSSICRDGADISDHLDAGHDLNSLIPLRPDDVPIIEDVESPADLYTPIDWHELWASTSAEPDWLVPGILERGRLHAIYAPRKHKKSLVALLMVAQLASGAVEVLGHPNPHDGPVRVMYIDIENAKDDIRQRLTDAGYNPDQLGHLTYFSFPSLPGLDSPSGGAHLLALIDRYRPDLLVLDTTSRVVTGKENDADTFRALYRHALAPVKATGTAILRLDHAGKNLELGQRGSSAKGDDLDTAWVISMPELYRVVLKLDFQRTNHHPQEIELMQHSAPLRFVRLDEAPVPAAVSRLADQMDGLGVARDAGRRVCRKALTDAGIKASDTTLNHAIKIRKSPPFGGGQDHENSSHTPLAHTPPDVDQSKIEKRVRNLDEWPTIPPAHDGAAHTSHTPHTPGVAKVEGVCAVFTGVVKRTGEPHTPPGGADPATQDPQKCKRCGSLSDSLALGECRSCLWQRGPRPEPDAKDQEPNREERS